MTQTNIKTSNSAVTPTAALLDADCATVNCDDRRPHYSKWHMSRSAQNMIAVFLSCNTAPHDFDGAQDAFDALEATYNEYHDDALENLSCTEEYQDYFIDLIENEMATPDVVIDAALNRRSVKEQQLISKIYYEGMYAFGGKHPAVTAALQGYTGELETMLAHKDAADRAAFMDDMKAYPFVQVAS